MAEWALAQFDGTNAADAEEAGLALLPGPFFSTVTFLAFGSVLDAVGTPAQKEKYIAPICK